MKPRHLEPASFPPAGLDGILPEWSRLVDVAATDGVGRTWHILDNQVADPQLTLLCVHGNPSWSYLWRRVIAGAGNGIRVVAVDQLDMGFSERTGVCRRLATRVDDLCELTTELGIDGPVVTVAHDWGGPVSLGWAERHLEQVAGVVLLNTAVHQPAGSPAPALIRTARTRGVLRRITVDTGGFITGALNMSHPRPAPEVRKGFHAPYKSAGRREAIADFVEDIPLEPTHPSAKTLDDIASGLETLANTPTLLMWGPNDKVFSDLYLHDFETRLPHADVHRFVGASHFVSEDADIVTPLYDWIGALPKPDAKPVPAAEPRPSRLGVGTQPLDDQLAVIEIGKTNLSTTFGELRNHVDAAAAGLAADGVRAGDRVALMIPPGVDLSIALYACWRAGAVAVLIDAGLGPRGMSRALASAAPDHLIGVPKAIAAAKLLRWPGRRIPIEGLHKLARSRASLPKHPDEGDPAIVVFTSGATGPSKGVRYLHSQAQAGVDVLVDLYNITSDDRLVAAFAPFALYGPSMGITSVVPDMDVTKPASLTAQALGDAAIAGDATLVFASPAALANVVRTSSELTDDHRQAFSKVRLLLSAGAPISPSLMRSAASLFPGAEAHTPYGMTEMIPVADISLTEIEAVSVGDGVCVGRPVPGVEVLIQAFDQVGRPIGDISAKPDTNGEVLVSGAHARSGYDRLWHTQFRSSQPEGWHRTGDAGHLDASGRLWIGGRVGDVIASSSGPVMPVQIELAAEGVCNVARASAVGIGPTGTQQIVVVVETSPPARRTRLAELALQSKVRSTTEHDIVAVFVTPRLPVDRRHNSKIDRPRVASWAERALSGRRARRI